MAGNGGFKTHFKFIMLNKIILASVLSGSLSLAAVAEGTDSALAKYNLTPAPAPTGLLLKKGDRLAICGDSITEQRKYSRLIEDYLAVCEPELQITVRQVGWGGETAGGFWARMTNDCLRFKPTLATTSYGMNDHHYKPYEDSTGAEYRSNMLGVVQAFKDHGVRVVVGSPGTITKVPWWEAGKYQIDDLNQCLGHLRNIDVELARQEKVAFADAYTPLLVSGALAKEKYGPKYELNGGDGIHPDWAGHLVMAYAYLKALGVSGEIANFTVDLAANKLTVSQGHKLLSAKDGTFEISSTRQPFCSGCLPFWGVNGYPNGGTENADKTDNVYSGMTLVPFNQELNRFRLTAKNATAPKYRVAWGDYSKVFTGEQLARGINLTEEFAMNPFSGHFSNVDAAVSIKQDFETRQIKTMFRPVVKKGENATMAQITAQTEKVLAETERIHAALDQAVRAAAGPVTYTIKVTAE